MGKKKDVSKLFANAFTKYDQIQGQPAHIQANMPTKIMEESEALMKAHQSRLYPEKAGKRVRDEKLAAEEQFRQFIRSLTIDEVENLKLLRSKPSLVVDTNALQKAGELGEDLGLERLEANKLIKRELIPDDNLIEFRITNKGRAVLEELRL